MKVIDCVCKTGYSGPHGDTCDRCDGSGVREVYENWSCQTCGTLVYEDEAFCCTCGQEVM